MKHKQISKAELPIMKVLWEEGELSSPNIFAGMEGNPSTLKTLLKRLVDKGTVGTNQINSRNFTYYPLLSREEYIAEERESFLKRVFDGSKKTMLLNFVKEEKISKRELEELLEMIEEEDSDD